MPPALPPAPPAEIVVTGQGLAGLAGDAAYDVVTIDRERLTSSASGRLEDVLRDVAGFQQYRRSDARSAHPTSQGATLRGLGGNASSRALVVLDGVPQIDPFGGWVTFTAFDPARLGQVRVTRGGGSGVFGPGALAGTIELDSAGPDTLRPVEGALAYGSRDTVSADATLSHALGGGFATLSASYDQGDGFIPIIASQRGPADRPADYRQGTVAARAIVPAGGDTELQANMLLLRDERNRGLDGTDNTTTGADASVRLVGRGRWGFEALAYLQMRQFSSGFASANADRTATTQTLDQFSVPATGIGGRIELRPPLPGGIELRLGSDARTTSGETNERYTYVAGQPTRLREAGGRTTTAGLFADLSLPLDERLILTGGGRVDRWWIADGRLRERTIATGAPLTNIDYADRNGTQGTARGGLSWSPSGQWRLRSAAYLGWRLPTLNELYRPFRAGVDATAANPALRPERLKGVDGGVDWTPLPNARLSATAFYNRLDNAIGNVTLGQGPGNYPGAGFVAAGGVYRQRGNLDAVRSRGVELDGQVTDGEWRLSGSYAFTDARVRGSGLTAALDGLRPAQTPRHTGSLTFGRTELSGLSAAATVRYVSRQYEDDQNSRTLNDATTLDLLTRIPLGRGLSVEARAENVTGTRVEATLSADGTIERATPRTLWIGLRLGG
ncbi:TonB-dependent receptor [uncultured Sphingomonas sp.]|uniref:TonB-dependent receptor n=1 Tax=uncultured Sphingomonas sp. TaxID=158754 RepID=UPI0025D672F3|nr:TonB-dependent receptor [uncultured Sphingomonas sp.]